MVRGWMGVPVRSAEKPAAVPVLPPVDGVSPEPSRAYLLVRFLPMTAIVQLSSSLPKRAAASNVAKPLWTS